MRNSFRKKGVIDGEPSSTQFTVNACPRCNVGFGSKDALVLHLGTCRASIAETDTVQSTAVLSTRKVDTLRLYSPMARMQDALFEDGGQPTQGREAHAVDPIIDEDNVEVLRASLAQEKAARAELQAKMTALRENTQKAILAIEKREQRARDDLESSLVAALTRLRELETSVATLRQEKMDLERCLGSAPSSINQQQQQEQHDSRLTPEDAWVALPNREDFREWVRDQSSSSLGMCCFDSLAGTSLPRDLGLVLAETADHSWLGQLQRESFGLNACVLSVVGKYMAVAVYEATKEAERARMIIIAPDGDERCCVTTRSNLDELRSFLQERHPTTEIFPVSSGFWATSLVQRLLVVDRDTIATENSVYKFGVIRWVSGQTESEAMANEETPEFTEFLNFLGFRVRVMDLQPGCRGGLSETTGEHTYATKATFSAPPATVSVVFHVPHMLPRGIETDNQLLERRRFTGNNVVNIIFWEGSSLFNPNNVSSHFNHAWVVVQRTGVTDWGTPRYGISIHSKGDFPRPRPFLPTGPFEQSEHLRKFIIALAVNLERSALHFSPAFVTKLRRTKAALIAAACEACAAGWKARQRSGSVTADELLVGATRLKRVAHPTPAVAGTVAPVSTAAPPPSKKWTSRNTSSNKIL